MPQTISTDTPAPSARVVIPSGRLPTDISTDIVNRAVAGNARSVKLINGVSHIANVPIVFGNQVLLLVDGPETFAAIEQAIKAAQHTIHLETYIFSDDDLGDKIQALLIERARAGVDVKVIYDAFGSARTDSDFFSEMDEAGVEIIAFRPVELTSIVTGKVNNRDHRKLLVVDGKIAFTGGVNISQVYSQSSSRGSARKKNIDRGWRDTHVQIEGPVVLLFQQLFLKTWMEIGGEVASAIDALFPTQQFAGNDMVSVVAGSKESFETQKIYQTYSEAIAKASSEILLTNAYFLPNEGFLDALAEAAERGVDVRIIVPGFSDSFLALYASRGTYGKLLESGVRIFEKQDAFLHAKTAVIDGVVSIVGSANLDMRSFVHNREISALVLGSDFGDQLRQLFQKDIESTREITLQQWQNRPVGDRLKEWWSNLFRYWL